MKNKNQSTPKPNGIARLAKSDFEAALKFSTSIPEVGKRIQALGWIARYAPEPRVESIANSAVKLALAPTDDAYAAVLALAWPLRALHETNVTAPISKILDEAIKLSSEVEPTSSRAEALVLIIHALLPAGIQAANPAIEALLTQCAGDDHWRIVRAFADSAVLVNACDKARASQIARAMPAGNKRDAALARVEAGETSEPRRFFW